MLFYKDVLSASFYLKILLSRILVSYNWASWCGGISHLLFVRPSLIKHFHVSIIIIIIVIIINKVITGLV